MATMSPIELPFKISVRIRKGEIQVSPDPAIVDQGKPIEWRFSVERSVASGSIELYFSGATPTGWNVETVRYSESTSSQPRIGAIAEDPGEYKYGIRATAEQTNEVVADDDPWLIVRPRL